MTPTNCQMKKFTVSLLVPAVLGGCAAVKGTPEAREDRGIILNRVDMPATNSYPSRGMAQSMGGLLGLLMVDAVYGEPRHFVYTIQLDSGGKITLNNTTEIPIGKCIMVWSKPDPRSRENHFPVKFNDIEESTSCTSKSPSNSGTSESQSDSKT